MSSSLSYSNSNSTSQEFLSNFTSSTKQIKSKNGSAYIQDQLCAELEQASKELFLRKVNSSFDVDKIIKPRKSNKDQTDKEHNVFLNMVIHDFRNPTNQINFTLE